MWPTRSVSIAVTDYGRGNTVLIEIMTPVGRLEAVGELEQIGRTLYFRRAPIQGLRKGALGRSGLNAIGAEILREAQVDAIVIDGDARTTGRDRNAGGDRHPSGIPVDLVLQAPGAIVQPVSLVRALVGFGLDLREAHDVVDRLTSRESVAVTLIITPESESFFSLQKLGVTADAPARGAEFPTGATVVPGDVLSAIDG